LLCLTIPVLVVGLNAARQDYGPWLSCRSAISNPAWYKVLPEAAVGLVAFALVAAFQSWAQQNMFTFVPKYLSDLGYSPSMYGLVVALFMGGTAFGNLFGGYLADHFGKRKVASLTLAAAGLPLVLIPGIAWVGWFFLLVPLSGMLTGRCTHPGRAGSAPNARGWRWPRTIPAACSPAGAGYLLTATWQTSTV
jgi:MFS family permease